MNAYREALCVLEDEVAKLRGAAVGALGVLEATALIVAQDHPGLAAAAGKRGKALRVALWGEGGR